MIIAHALIGVMPGNSDYLWPWFIGSVIPDIDHIFILMKKQIFSLTKIVDSIRFEEKYNIKFKTKYFHSIFGAIILAMPAMALGLKFAAIFFIAYLIHLFLDAFDIDEKQIFYPFKKKIRGFLPIFSKVEILFTICLLIILLKKYV